MDERDSAAATGKAAVIASAWERLSGRDGSLRERVLRGSVWLVVAEGATRMAGMVKIAILARLLSPDDFGQMGTAMLVLQWIEYFTQTGFNAALVQKDGNIRPYLDTAWTVQVARSAVLAAAMFLGAPLGAAFFRSEAVTPLIRAIALTTLVRGLGNPAAVYLRKSLDFRREFLWRAGGAFAGLLVAVPFALAYRNVWALVLSVIAAQVTETAITYVVRPYRPRLALEWGRARELMRFGKWIFWSNVIAFCNQEADSMVVGRVLGLSTLGFYQMARNLAAMPTSQLGMLLSGVMFPAYTHLKDGAARRRVFLRTLVLVSALVIPLGCLLAVFAEPLVVLTIGQRWAGIASTFRILVWAGVVTALTGVATPLLLAVGRPDVPTKCAFVRTCALAVMVVPLLMAFGGEGVAASVALSSVVSATLQFVMVARLVGITPRTMLASARGAAMGSLPFLIAGLFLLASPPAAVLVAVALGATVAYLAVLRDTLRQHFLLPRGER